MQSSLKAFRSNYEACISRTVLQQPTASLSLSICGRWNHGHVAACHRTRPDGTTIRTAHTFETSHNGDDSLITTERENIRKFLKQGYAPWDVWRILGMGRIPPGVFVTMLEEDKELASLVRKPKRGKWSMEEKEYLLKLTHNRRRIDIESIARQTGREPGSIRYQLRLLAKEKVWSWVTTPRPSQRRSWIAISRSKSNPSSRGECAALSTHC